MGYTEIYAPEKASQWRVLIVVLSCHTPHSEPLLSACFNRRHIVGVVQVTFGGGENWREVIFTKQLAR